MYKIWIVARREYLALVTTKSFWLGLLVPPVVGLLTMFMALSTPVVSDPGPARIVLVDHSGFVGAALEAAAQSERLQVERVRPTAWSQSRQTPSAERVRQGELFAVVDVPLEISDATPVRIQIEKIGRA